MTRFSGLDHQGPITKEAQEKVCPTHPDGTWRSGFGYAGGGFGPYRICNACNTVFGKVEHSER